MPKSIEAQSIEVPINPKIVVGDGLIDFAECIKRIAASQEKPKKTIGEIRYENAILAVLTRIADALDAIHGTLAQAALPENETEVPDDPE